LWRQCGFVTKGDKPWTGSKGKLNPVTPSPATLCHQGNGGTAYCNFDAFGRPGTVMTADGKTTLLEYQGVRAIKRNRRVWDGTKEVLGTTREEYDGLGRLHRIREPNGTWTRYDYDEGGRLAAVTANAGGSHPQSRSFHYDERGFLAREVQPESGAVSYKYDARGNLTQKITPTGTILYDYDGAGRLTQVSSPQAPLRIFTYSPSGVSTGKLAQARAFNDRQVGSSCLTYEVRQDFAYNSSHGRLQTEATSLFQGGTALEKWSQGYTYDGAGEVTTFSYPSCLAGCNAAPRSQTVSYAMGRPTAVPHQLHGGYENESSYRRRLRYFRQSAFLPGEFLLLGRARQSHRREHGHRAMGTHLRRDGRAGLVLACLAHAAGGAHQRQDGTWTIDVYLAIFDLAGHRLSGSNATPITTAVDAQFLRGFVFDAARRQGLAVWEDRRKGTWDDLDTIGGLYEE
jgi:YD repeat-containing protein